jgi:hypothetical protein
MPNKSDTPERRKLVKKKISLGEYEMQRVEGFSKQHLQLQFLIATSLITPEVFVTFENDPYQEFLELINEDDSIDLQVLKDTADLRFWMDKCDYKQTVEYEDIFEIPQKHCLDGTNPDLANKYLQSLDNWSQKWNLKEKWVGDRLLSITHNRVGKESTRINLNMMEADLNEWQQAWMKGFDQSVKDLRDCLEEFEVNENFDIDERKKIYIDELDPSLLNAIKLEWLFQSTHKLFDEAILINPPIGLPPWELNIQTESEYLEVVRKAAKEKIEQDELLSQGKRPVRNQFLDSIVENAKVYCEQVKEKYNSSQNWIKVEDKFNLTRNLIWAVIYQVQEKSLGDIVKLFLSNEATISRGVDESLSLLGLEKRKPLDPGAKLGKKDKHAKKSKKP